MKHFAQNSKAHLGHLEYNIIIVNLHWQSHKKFLVSGT